MSTTEDIIITSSTNIVRALRARFPHLENAKVFSGNLDINSISGKNIYGNVPMYLQASANSVIVPILNGGIHLADTMTFEEFTKNLRGFQTYVVNKGKFFPTLQQQ